MFHKSANLYEPIAQLAWSWTGRRRHILKLRDQVLQSLRPHHR